MSFSKSTPHFGLPQYQDNDPQSVPQWNTDITEAFAKIDDVLYTSQDKADQAIEFVAEATEAATNAEASASNAVDSASNATTSAQEAVEKTTALRNGLFAITPNVALLHVKSWTNATGIGGNVSYTVPEDGSYMFHLNGLAGKVCRVSISVNHTNTTYLTLVQVDARAASSPTTCLSQLFYLAKGTYTFNIEPENNATNLSVYKVVYV